MIKGRNIGDNITIMNTMFRKIKKPESEKFLDVMTIIYKDCDTGQKHMQEIVNPEYNYYIVKDDSRVGYNRLFVEEDKLEKVTVPYGDLEKDIAKRTGNTEVFYDNIRNGNRYENRRLHLHPDVFFSDMHIEDRYRYEFDKLYKNDICPITKSFFDIEADTINMIGDFPEKGECPINAISLILQEQRQIYVFLLRNKNNPQIAEFEKSVIDGSIFPELENFVIEKVGGPERAEKLKIDFKYNFLFYDEEDEINLIKDLFNAINTFKPDFALAWNMGFDMPYIFARIEKLGYDVVDIVCHKDFKYPFAYYFEDKRMESEFAERGDFADVSAYTTYLDQMIHFASRRKSQSKFPSFTLDYIGEVIAKVKKLDYKDITTNISQLPYKSYKTFVFYNIMDTIVQYCIEMKTGDMDYVFNKSLLNNTRYQKTHRQTVYLTNRGAKEFSNSGFIMGNNTNKFNPPPAEKFPGAFVAEPLQVNGHSKLRIYGRLINAFDNCNDFDYSALYPSVIRQYNIAPHTQIGLINIPNVVHNKENMANMDNWTRSLAFMEDLQSRVWLEFSSRWFNLASYTELYHEVEKFFTTKAMPIYGLRYTDRNGLIIPIHYCDNNNVLESPIIYEDNRYNVSSNYQIPDLNNWERWRNYATANPNQYFGTDYSKGHEVSI